MEIKGLDFKGQKFGFGCMRLPMKGGDVDIEQVKGMVDLFLESGFNYFDIAHGYIGGKSETALKEALTTRYPRDCYILTNKLTGYLFKKEEDILPLFQKQLEACGVEYFDLYLMHAQSAQIYEQFKRCRAYEIAYSLKEQGKIKHFGISFHDKAEVLDMILTEHPEIELVQIQFNYLDYEDPAVQSRKCYEVCVKHSKPVVIMEPIKGGNLIKLPEDALKTVRDFGVPPQSLALRFAATPENVVMVLSGMSSIEQMRDDISFMKDFLPLSKEEIELTQKVSSIFKSKNMIGCTACRYCTDGCPKHISIPDLFSLYNAKKVFHDWNADYYYSQVHTVNNGKAGECIKCGKCERICPQKLPIRALLSDVAAEFER